MGRAKLIDKHAALMGKCIKAPDATGFANTAIVDTAKWQVWVEKM